MAIPRPSSFASSVNPEAPLEEFSRCHEGILTQLGGAAELPGLLQSADRARTIAGSVVQLFQHAVLQHHREEEDELFSAVLRSAKPGEEAATVDQMVGQLTREHRVIETQWKTLEPQLRAAAKGEVPQLDAALLNELVNAYLQHARFEEEKFLPLAASILGRNGNHMAALGLALHMRHMPEVVGYI